MRDHWDDRLVGLESVLLGERNLAQQTLEIVIFGYATSQEAEGALRRQWRNLSGLSGRSEISELHWHLSYNRRCILLAETCGCNLFSYRALLPPSRTSAQH